MQVSGTPEFHRLVIGTGDVDDCGVNSPDLACSEHPYPRGPALIVEPVGVTNAPTYKLYIMGFHVVAWSQPDVAWSRRSHVNTIVYICVL